jgi:hypothetical protein
MDYIVSTLHKVFPTNPNVSDVMALHDHLRTHALLEHISRFMRIPGMYPSIRTFEKWRRETAGGITELIAEYRSQLSPAVLTKCCFTLVLLEVPGTKEFAIAPHFTFDLFASGRISTTQLAEVMGAHWAATSFWDAYEPYLIALKLPVTGETS